MLRSYSAQLNGAELTWLGQPPVFVAGTRVLVVVDEEPAVTEPAPVHYDLADLAGRLQWQGDAVAAQRAQRDGW
nr:hypothetical protein [uncultured Albidiferax sp.]